MRKKIILASASPRRQELLRQIGMEFEVRPSSCEEKITADDPAAVVEELSFQKAEDIAERMEKEGSFGEEHVIIGADTVVADNEKILGKPADEAAAREMLTALSGHTHHVYTGVTLIWKEEGERRSRTFHEDTKVSMYPITEEEIEAYIASGEPNDKAGSYGIQGGGAAFISGIEGDYNNVVGLPVAGLYQEMKKIFGTSSDCQGKKGAPKAVIFDLDGTLADTLTSITYCTNRSLAQHGLPSFTPQDYRYFVGDGAAMLIQRALERCGNNAMEQFDEVLATYTENFREDCMYEVNPYPGVTALLEELKARGIKICVLSNKPHPNTVHVVETLFGRGFFDIVQGQTPEIRRKPDPSGVYKILEKLQLKKEDVLYVGDSCVDMDTGKAAGVMTVGVLWGFRDREELEEHGADALVAKADELLRFADAQ